jgi:NAD(P)-dependent dehydrogenase (short-subunit alcohol dehydrogenase family)
MQIQNSATIITGGASGIGEACARLLAQRGAKVIIFDRNQQTGPAIAKDIGGLFIAVDICDEQAVAAALKTLAQTISQPLRCVINCAGILLARRMVNKQGLLALAAFKQVIDVNLTGTYNVLAQAADAMINHTPADASGERGVIINTASVAAFEGQIGQTAYSASKGGVIALTLPAARELAAFGIRVMTIAPGLVKTPMFANLSPDARLALGQQVPFPQRLAEPDEYAQLALHIIENSMLNGSTIRLDGALRLPPK